MAKKRIVIDPKKYEGTKLHIIDVSAVMRSNYVPLGFVPRNKWEQHKRELSWEVDGEKFNTSSLFGLFRMLKTYGMKDHYLFCFDTPKNIRKMEDPAYKEGRPLVDQEYYDQVNAARRILQDVGFTVCSVEGYEADDFVVEGAKQFKGTYDHVFVHTNDFDLAQTVDDNVYLKNVNKKHGDVHRDNYDEMLECPYNMVLLYKAMVGDKSDNKKGIYRFGKKKFYDFLDAEGLYEKAEGIRKSYWKWSGEWKVIEESETLTEDQKNQAYATLEMVLPRLPKDYVMEEPKMNFNRDMFNFLLGKYGMNSIRKILD